MKNSDAYKTIDYRGCKIDIIYDQDPESPDAWGNDDMFIVYDHRDFNIQRKGFDPGAIFEDTQRLKKSFYDGYHVFPLYAYIHSGVSLSLGRDSYPFTCPWDTSMAGFVLVEKTKGWSWRRDKARKCAESLVSEWNIYLSGQVFGYNAYVPDEDGEEDHGIGSCWGYYGDPDEKDAYIVSEAKASIDWYLKDQMKKRADKLKTFIRNRVPLENRLVELDKILSEHIA
jgi:hypothetical protein